MDIFSKIPNEKINNKPSDQLSKTNSKQSSLKQTSKSGGGCPKGKIMRHGYITNTGKIVNNSCITAQSSTGRKSSDDLKKYIMSREKMQREAKKRFSKEISKKCPKGYIMREGYKKESYKSHSKNGDSIKVKSSWTKPQCIKSQTGKSEKSNKLIVIMEKDVLGKYGYKHIKSSSPSERRNALRKALRDIKPLSIYRRLVALSTLNKGKDIMLSKILKEDSEWIKTQSLYIADRISSKVSKNSKSSKQSSKKYSKKSSKQSSKQSFKKNQGGGDILERYNTLYNPRYNLNDIKTNSKKSNSKLSLSKRNKLFYYKDK
jgi:hypothetical protein